MDLPAAMHAQCIGQRLSRPLIGLAEQCVDTILCCCIRIVVGQHQEVFAVAHEPIDHRGGIREIVRREESRLESIDRAFQFRIRTHHLRRRVPLRASCGDFFGRHAEDKDVFRTHGIANLDVGAVERADGQRTIERELHIAGAGGFHGRFSMYHGVGGNFEKKLTAIYSN